MADRDPESIRSAAREILHSSEFDEVHPSRIDQFLHYLSHPWDLLDPVYAWLQRALSGTGHGSTIGWIAAVLFVLVAIALVVRLTRSLTPTAHADVVVDGVVEHADSAKALLRAAERAASAGDWREEIRLRYGAAVVMLSDQEVVQIWPGKTTGEYLREVERKAPKAAGAFRQATSTFEWVWYGKGKATEQMAASMRPLAQQLRKDAAA